MTPGATELRCVVLTGILAIGAWLATLVDRPPGPPGGRWPSEDAVYAADGWAAGPLSVERRGGTPFISRAYARADGVAATLVIATSPEAKRIYRAGADVPFLGNGYTAEAAPAGLVAPASGHGALLVSGKGEQYLALYTYGERRGLLGNGALGWGMFVVDATVGRANDYYKFYLVAPLRRWDSSDARAAAALADVLFPRLGAWYAT